MSDDVAVAIISEIGRVTLALIVALILWLLRKQISAVLPRLHHVKVAGLELQLAAAALSESRGDRLKSPHAAETLVEHAASLRQRLEGFRILWVDDSPANNDVERRFLRSAGATVVNALSTAEAMRELGRDDFDVMVTNFRRDGSPVAGIELAALAFDEGYRLPVLGYIGDVDPRRPTPPHIEKVTNHPDVLIERLLDIARTRQS